MSIVVLDGTKTENIDVVKKLMSESDVIGFIIPCYVSTLPAMDIRFLEELMNNYNDEKYVKVYQNCRSNFPKEIASSIAVGLNNKGYTVTLNTAGDFLPKDVSKYHVLVLGSATLAGNVGEPLRKYTENIENYSNSKIILYSTGADMSNMKELDQLSSLLSKEPAQKVKFDYFKKENSKDKAVSLGNEIGNN